MYMNNLLSDEGSAFARIAVSTRWSNIIILVHRLLLYDGFVSSFTKEYDPDGEKITSLVYTNEQTIQAYLVQLQQMITSQLTVSVHIHNLFCISILINTNLVGHLVIPAWIVLLNNN